MQVCIVSLNWIWPPPRPVVRKKQTETKQNISNKKLIDKNEILNYHKWERKTLKWLVLFFIKTSMFFCHLFHFVCFVSIFFLRRLTKSNSAKERLSGKCNQHRFESKLNECFDCFFSPVFDWMLPICCLFFYVLFIRISLPILIQFNRPPKIRSK